MSVSLERNDLSSLKDQQQQQERSKRSSHSVKRTTKGEQVKCGK